MKKTEVYRCSLCGHLYTKFYKLSICDRGFVRSIPFYVCQYESCPMYIKIEVNRKIKIKYPDEEFIWNYEQNI